MAHIRDREFRDNLKGTVRTLFLSQETPESLTLLDITNIFLNSVVAQDNYSGKFFISFYLSHLLGHQAYDDTLSFMQTTFFHLSVDGLRFFERKEFNPHDTIFYLQLNLDTILYYMMTLL